MDEHCRSGDRATVCIMTARGEIANFFLPKLKARNNNSHIDAAVPKETISRSTQHGSTDSVNMHHPESENKSNHNHRDLRRDDD